MPTITQRANGSWQVKIRLPGHPSISQTFDSKLKARAWGVAEEARLRDQVRGMAKATLLETMDRYRLEVATTLKSGPNVAKRLKALAARPGLLPVHRQVSEVTAVDLSRFRDTRMAEVSPATVRKELTILRSVLESARRDWGLITVNPISDVKKPPATAARKRLFSDAETALLLAHLGYSEDVKLTSSNHQVAAAIVLGLETAMRAGEMLGLEWSRVHLAKRYVTLPMTKNGDARDVPLSTKAAGVLARLQGLDQNRVFTISSASLDVLFRRARDKCGIKGLHFHDSRATAVTRLAEKLSIHDLARMIGHRDLKSLLIYYRKSATDIANQLD